MWDLGGYHNKPPLQPRTTQIVTSPPGIICPPSCTAAITLQDTLPDLLLSGRLSTQGTTCRSSSGLGPVVTTSHHRSWSCCYNVTPGFSHTAQSAVHTRFEPEL
ncbi:hypothetical protein JCGZ_02782 [Jatropha curcas]|uniref:Uncharacterized protein n=1 Tax=Jatropha curcas TaxID=180498 RepID=A0A067KUH3_JATCU|nr:hypothetical protein JCGZ_02782 [Jatropha curcas]